MVDNVNGRALAEANQNVLDATLENITGSMVMLTARTDQALAAVGGALTDDGTIDARISAAQRIASSSGLSAVGIYDEHGVKIDTLLTDTGEHTPTLPNNVVRDERARYDTPTVWNGTAFMLRCHPIAGGEKPWTVAVMVPLAPIADRVTNLVTHSLPPSSSLLLVTPDLVAVVDSQGERVGLKVGGRDAGPLGDVHGDALGRGFKLDGEFTRGDGEKVIGAIRTIEDAPLAVVAEIPRRVALSSLSRVRRYVVVAVALAILGAIITGAVLARRLTRPIRALVTFADDLAQRRFSSRITIQANDELRVLGDALQSAATELAASDAKLEREAAIRSDLGRYLPNQLVDQIVARERQMTLGGERRDVTVVFADVVGFTPLAERQSAETVVTLLNELFTILTEIVFRHGGTVDKFIGDCVMAVWGAPEPHADHARRALAAALDMQHWLEVSNDSWFERFGIKIELAIGVNSGEAVVGNFGSESRMEYTAIGDIVNVAARLEAIARPSQVLTTRATMERANDNFTFISLGARSITGKTDPVDLYEVRK
ncbi:MAG: adenylate/guanylate cyclase domain-containing protein [Kofleriaceae bacterium]